MRLVVYGIQPLSIADCRYGLPPAATAAQPDPGATGRCGSICSKHSQRSGTGAKPQKSPPAGLQQGRSHARASSRQYGLRVVLHWTLYSFALSRQTQLQRQSSRPLSLLQYRAVQQGRSCGCLTCLKGGSGLTCKHPTLT